ncbi:hypothetical protein XCCB100_4477 [Xanthomonas campestris pv. campestris]|uniref:Uncharacterized protein n=14 Tax=Xanthomonas campestris TaxID=339 RepID=A0A1X7QFN6_XANCB|nr:hypothetical protein XCCB100_4477 [Xanthomonas campestris pv. campestris]
MVHLHCTLAVCAAVGPATGHAVNPSMEAQWRHPCRHMVPPPDPPPLCRYRAVRAKSEERRARNEERRAACVASAHAISRQKCSAPRAEMHLCRSAAQIMTKPCLRRSALVRDEAFPSIPSRTSALLQNARSRCPMPHTWMADSGLFASPAIVAGQHVALQARLNDQQHFSATLTAKCTTGLRAPLLIGYAQPCRNHDLVGAHLCAMKPSHQSHRAQVRSYETLGNGP